MTHENIAAALAAFQAELPRVGKDNTARVTSEKGQYTYRYADLSEITPAVVPLLAKQGLAWTTRPTLWPDGKFVLHYALTHTSGEAIEGTYPLPNPASSAQALGSAITYARRYALCAVTGVAPGDDDDDAAAAQRAAPAPPARSRPGASAPAASGPQGQAQPQAGQAGALAAPASKAAAAALQLLGQTCDTNQWSRNRVEALWNESHPGQDLRQASMREIEEFRKGLFSRPDHELREPEEATADA